MRILKAKVYGKVQGVWFRKYTLDCANRFGIVGNVKNLPDGTVLVQAMGKNLEKFKMYLNSGPPNSNVNKIDFSWDTSKIEFSEFKIEY
tara:strand:+ start:446 stop:712 length:267 start_codon:yes stop_codon:yes gene_type:complete